MNTLNILVVEGGLAIVNQKILESTMQDVPVEVINLDILVITNQNYINIVQGILLMVIILGNQEFTILGKQQITILDNQEIILLTNQINLDSQEIIILSN
jgi:hypothetical protein